MNAHIEQHEAPRSLLAILAKRAIHQADKTAFTFIDDKNQRSSISYSELYRDATSLACHLKTKLDEGERAVLLYPPGLDYIRAFYACLYAGIVAVPLYPPVPNQKLDRIDKVVKSCNAQLALFNDQVAKGIHAFSGEHGIFQPHQLLQTDQLLRDTNNHLTAVQPALPPIAEDNLAFLQYTSGSTGLPKGVKISHGNIVANLEALTAQTGCNGDDVFVNWLPLFHDLGLVNTMLLPVFLGSHSVLMSPVRFVKRPSCWFEAISEFKGTICGAPNFAFDLCVAKIAPEDYFELDLSQWRIAFNAAEPINPDTLARFGVRFAGLGFKANAFYPSYGMAEATVFLSGGQAAAPSVIRLFDKQQLKNRQATLTDSKEQGQKLVGCGAFPPHHHFHIVDPDSQQTLNEGQVGEVWVAGPSIAKGYWELEELSQAVFGAQLANDDTPYLRTGDLGFCTDGELYISGRIKDVIIVRGQNYYPQDLERIGQESHRAIRPGCCVAFTSEHNDNVILAVEINPRQLKQLQDAPLADQIRQAAKSAISQELELSIDTVLLLPPGTLPKTSSGKVQRTLTKQRFHDGHFTDLVAETEASNGKQATSQIITANHVMAQLAPAWAEVLKLNDPSSLTPESHFFNSGGDSLAATQLIAEAEKHFSLTLDNALLFEHQTLGTLAAFIEQAIQQATSQPTVQPEKAVPRTGAIVAPLSSAQQRLWLMNQLGHGELCNLPLKLTLSGELDRRSLQEALQYLVNRHETLRTCYPANNGIPQQQVEGQVDVTLSEIDLSHLDHVERQQQLEAVQANEAKQNFSLEHGPIFAAKLVILGPEQHQLLFTVHHIAVDGWSMRILLKELKACYLAAKAKTQADLPALDISYIDYSQWQNNQLAESTPALLSYWQKQLAGAPALLELPYDSVRPARQSFNGGKHTEVLPSTLIEQVKHVANQHGATPFMVMLAAYQILLRALSDQDDIIVGTDIANRNHPQLGNKVGFFVNQLVLRNQIDPNASIAALIDNVKATTLEAFSHQELPFDKLVEGLCVDRNPQYSPLFQVKFLFNINPSDELAGIGLETTVEGQDNAAAQYDLTLSVDQQADQSLSTTFHYNSDLFHTTSINQMMACYQQILTALVTNTEQPLSEVTPWLDRTAPASNPPPTMSFREVGLQVHQHALEHPDKIAVSTTKVQLTQAELDRQSNRLANFLGDIAQEPDVPVGIYLERSTDLVIAVLACIKAGIPFLPLDPDYPDSRIEFMLEDSNTELLITHSSLEGQLVDYCGATIQLDEAEAFLGDYPNSLPDIATANEALAYVLYTSGSTGQPKGVKIAQQSLANLCQWYIEFAKLTPASRVLQLIPFSFDASIKNIIAPLMAGAQLTLAPSGRFDAFATCELIASEQITFFNCVPSVLYSLVQASENHHYRHLQSLKLVAMGAEVPDLNKLIPWLSQGDQQCDLANIYGPTECTDISSAFYLKHADIQSARMPLPIGQSLPGCQLHIINQETLAPTYPGVSGELLIAGIGVGLGYLNNRQENKAKYITNPFGEGLAYRTGDLAKLNNNGQLEYLGRIDQQVKLNGIRIELGEIERSLQVHDAIEEAVVIVKAANQLVAFVKSTILTPPSPAQLRQYLASSLPESMLPSAIAFVDDIPRLPNGKVNRQVLADIPLQSNASAAECVEPRNDVEQQLAAIWQEALESTNFGVRDNFFELGGDSILCVQVVAKAEKIGLLFTVADMFEHQTIEQLADITRQSTPANDIEEDDDFDLMSDADREKLFS
ncbi:amino acid adenylation domain-containing protein [Photobacterium minamisatsumaniensis]|uniref:amino acid adenylation domain-containing protein n=1 Tax=Photobacterium minamisatsumaniensis TaxID=2910233 RepID=UPI003D14BF25